MTSDYNLAANVAVKEFLSSKKVKDGTIQVVGIVETTTFRLGDKDSWKRAKRLLLKSGLKFFLKTSLLNHWQKMYLKFQKYVWAEKDRKVFEIKELAKKNRIPFLHIDDINSEKSREFMKEKNPDYLVSCLLLQKVSKEVLEIPRKNSINFHPALFTQHRGTWSAFWAILTNSRKWGATVHIMTENFDEGEIVVQKRFGIDKNESIFSVSQKSAKIGGRILVKALMRLRYKNRLASMKKAAMARLFTTPREEDVRKLRKMNKKIIYTEEVLSLN